MKTQLKVHMLGNSFTIQSDEPREHVEEVIAYLQARVTEVLEKNPGTEPVKIALIAGLNAAFELLNLKKSAHHPLSPGQNGEVEAITRHLIDKIDAVLDPDLTYPAAKSE
jgi:hypothetical protein